MILLEADAVGGDGFVIERIQVNPGCCKNLSNSIFFKLIFQVTFKVQAFDIFIHVTSTIQAVSSKLLRKSFQKSPSEEFSFVYIRISQF